MLIAERFRAVSSYMRDDPLRTVDSASMRSERSNNVVVAGLTTIVIAGVVTDPAVFEAETVNVNGPAAEGVPLSNPFDESVRPVGREPE